ncbi:MAG: cytochrome c-type biogenesis protein CcmH [Betaproteobacteria bacterium]|nr:cytochrome c-type biogenesis protein CcmH [Betaproteobacteria bacterium]
MRAALALLLAVMLVAPAAAGEAAPAAEDPALEKRVIELAAELRCLVCQNQSLADSNAGLAVDLRNQIRERMREGQSESQIVDFMVARYGDFVLYRPPVKATTALLWFGPILLVVVGLVVLFVRLRRRRAAAEPELSAVDHERAARLLAPGDEAETR